MRCVKLKFSKAAVTETRCRGARGREGLGGEDEVPGEEEVLEPRGQDGSRATCLGAEITENDERQRGSQ